MKKCFTINHMRTTEDFVEYKELIKNGIYQGVEIFYPYQLTEEGIELYRTNVLSLHTNFPKLEIVLHLPHGPNNSLTDLENLENNIKRMKEAIDFTSIFDTKKLTLHLGYVRERNREEVINNIIGVLKDISKYAKQYNMNLMIENMPGIGEIGYSPKEILNIIERVNVDNLKFILDTGHAHVSEYELTDYVYTLKDYLYHMHFNDNNGTRDEHKRMGLGTIDFDILFKALKDIKYDELHCMEVIFKDSNDLKLFANDLSNYDK